MSDNLLPTEINLQKILIDSLNEQGYLFQQACQYDIERNNTGWSVRSSEYPVSTPGQDSKIDLVLLNNQLQNKFVLVECKRADPNYECWLFAGPKVELRYSPECQVLCLDYSSMRSDDSLQLTFRVKPLSVDVPTHISQTWQEVKAKTSGRVSNSQNIENAFAQVLRGLSGFAQEQLNQKCKEYKPFTLYFIPVVITTAKIYVAKYNVKDIDLTTGKIGINQVVFDQKEQSPAQQPWVLVHYGASDSISPSPIPNNVITNDPKQLSQYKVRSIFVVNSCHLMDFLKICLYKSIKLYSLKYIRHDISSKILGRFGDLNLNELDASGFNYYYRNFYYRFTKYLAKN